MKIGLAASIIPCFCIIGGVFIVHLSLLGSVLIYNAGLLTGIGVAMMPLLQSRADS